jgi:hypothetical protein
MCPQGIAPSTQVEKEGRKEGRKELELISCLATTYLFII